MNRWIVVSLMVASAGCSTDIFIGPDGGDPQDAQGDAQVDGPSSDGDSEMGDAKDGSVSNPDGEGGLFDGALDAPVDAVSADAEGGKNDAGVSCSSVDVSACSHSPCVTGAALPSGCDSSGDDIVTLVCTVYSAACCSTAWTSTCVTYAGALDSKCGTCI